MEVVTIDSLPKWIQFLHNHSIIEMSWHPEIPSFREKHWEWQPTNNWTIYTLYYGMLIFMIIMYMVIF